MFDISCTSLKYHQLLSMLKKYVSITKIEKLSKVTMVTVNTSCVSVRLSVLFCIWYPIFASA